MSCTYVHRCRALRLDYEDTSALLLPTRKDSDGKESEEEDDDDDEDDEYIIYLNF